MGFLLQSDTSGLIGDTECYLDKLRATHVLDSAQFSRNWQYTKFVTKTCHLPLCHILGLKILLIK
jgi:hypothetical protein